MSQSNSDPSDKFAQLRKQAEEHLTQGKHRFIYDLNVRENRA